jgi:glycosyltransferase involved in cell wall biosynthesis
MTAASPVFSVATPTRNSLDKLKRCVGSVRGQTEVALEHLVQDAASTDGTAEWLRTQAAMHDDLYPVSEVDGGMYDAINRCWQRSTGRYLSWLNSDEQYLPGALAQVQACFEAHPSVDVVSGDFLVTDAHGRAIALRREIPLRRFYVANTHLNTMTCTLFFRRELWDRGLLQLDTRYRYAADKDLVLRLLAAGARFHHLPVVLSAFGIDGTNLSTHQGMAQEAEAVRLAFGAFRWRTLRALAFGARRAERLLRGCYGKTNMEYSYAIDELPRYARFEVKRLGSRYSLFDAEGIAELVDTTISTAKSNHERHL